MAARCHRANARPHSVGAIGAATFVLAASVAHGAVLVNNDPGDPTWMTRADMAPAMLREDAEKYRSFTRAKGLNAYGPSSDFLVGTQESQWNVYYCGPAAVAASLRQIGMYHPGTWVLNQRQAAAALGTSRDGTPWFAYGDYPVVRTLNRYTPYGVHYVAHFVHAPTRAEIRKLRRIVRFDVALDRHPVLGNAFEAPNSRYHLTGHPADRVIFHWINIRGYSAGGRRIHYQDSAAGASSVTWHSAVPAYSSTSARAMTTIVAGRGYVW